MDKNKTPKPGSEDYNVEDTKNLNRPKYNSSTDRRDSSELPGVENLNDEHQELKKENDDVKIPNTDLGNKRDDNEEDREKLITP